MTRFKRLLQLTHLHRAGLAGLVVVAISPLTWADIATIHLTDGSKLRGEVVSLKDGAYTITNDTLGRLSIPADRVRLVAYGQAATTATTPPTGSADRGAIDPAAMTALQSQLMGNPDILSMIQSLQNAPEVQAILNDPEIKAALASGNYSALMDNPKILRLMNNRTVRQITDQVQ